MFYVYAIRSAVTSRLYVGQTRDMTARLAAHNAGGVRSTKQDRPWRLLKAILVKRVKLRAGLSFHLSHRAAGGKHGWDTEEGLRAGGGEAPV